MPPDQPQPVIRVRDLVNRFGSQTVHDGLDLDVYPGEILGVVGGSGTGKSVLMRSIIGLQTPASGAIEVLVLPRTIALILMMPLLAFYASVLGVIGGGLFSWLDLGIPPATFAQRLREVVPMSDFWVGLSKAPVFGAIIAIIGCHQGFQVTGNAESVGQRTTQAVVEAIFIVIVLDAFFAVFYTALGLS